MLYIVRLLIVTIFIFGLVSCGSSNDFVGKWANGESNEFVEFKDDGTVWYIDEGTSPAEVTLIGTYIVDEAKSTITMISSGTAEGAGSISVYTFSDNGNRVRIEDIGGKSVSVLEKVD